MIKKISILGLTSAIALSFAFMTATGADSAKKVKEPTIKDPVISEPTEPVISPIVDCEYPPNPYY